ncbi:MAG: hypothetical protein IPI35_21335 [Deltaproteobacteria bacterium]|nr:hypothetical protein [Deltaproteobacteria bacterium]
MTYADMLREEGEQRGLQRGKEEARHGAYVEALSAILQSRFGPLPSWASAHLETLDEGRLLALIPQTSAPSLEALLTPDQPSRV